VRETSHFVAKRHSQDEFLRNLADSQLFSPEEVAAAVDPLRQSAQDGETLAERLVATGKLTRFQADAVLERRLDELVIGNYQVIDRLGAGGMGTVYKARHRRMKRIVAIKVLSRSFGQSPKLVQRFQREVEAAARLSHPNIVMAHDADEAEVGHFLVMEFVNGRDLDSEVQKRGPLPVADAIHCIVQAARALGYAHGQGIVHRDIKPANLLRDTEGVVKVADLGLARFNDPFGQPAAEVAALTQAGTIMGTVDFMPPEQALGLTNIDHRADVYSLGCTLYFLLTGGPPFPGPSLMAVLLKHREAAPPSLVAARGEIPAGLEQIFHRMVAKKPEERFASMADVITALEAVKAEPEPPRKAARPTPVQPAAAGLGGQTVDAMPLAPSPTARTVLLVEPSRFQAVVIRKYLDQAGFIITSTVSSGQKALEAARSSPPAAVISALHLDDMTGLELARHLREETSLAAVGFVLISSETDSPAGSEQVVRLTKPFTAEQLAAALEAATTGPPRSTQAGVTDTAEQIRILVVDDSAAARSHVRRVLGTAGLSFIVEAKDGREAVALLEKERFDLVVTDYNMPNLDGLGVVDFIRRRSSNPSVPVILVTTETDPNKLQAVRRLGVEAICEKAFPLEVIRQVLQRRGGGHV
jgi:serine/threonine protein kinase